MATIREVLESSKRCKAQLEQLGYTLPKNLSYRVSGRMSRSLGICSENFRTNSFDIAINSTVPLEILDDTMIHEQIHAILGVKEGHGWRFQQLAQQVNRAYGYSVGTVASAKESAIMRSVRMERMASIPTVNLTCMDCNKTFTLPATKKAAKHPELYRCKCGGHLSK